MDTLRCPTCLTLLLDGGEKRCPGCHAKLKRSKPIVLGEDSRITSRPALLLERERQARIDEEKRNEGRRQRREAKKAARATGPVAPEADVVARPAPVEEVAVVAPPAPPAAIEPAINATTEPDIDLTTEAEPESDARTSRREARSARRPESALDHALDLALSTLTAPDETAIPAVDADADADEPQVSEAASLAAPAVDTEAVVAAEIVYEPAIETHAEPEIEPEPATETRAEPQPAPDSAPVVPTLDRAPAGESAPLPMMDEDEWQRLLAQASGRQRTEPRDPEPVPTVEDAVVEDDHRAPHSEPTSRWARLIEEARRNDRTAPRAELAAAPDIDLDHEAARDSDDLATRDAEVAPEARADDHTHAKPDTTDVEPASVTPTALDVPLVPDARLAAPEPPITIEPEPLPETTATTEPAEPVARTIAGTNEGRAASRWGGGDRLAARTSTAPSRGQEGAERQPDTTLGALQRSRGHRRRRRRRISGRAGSRRLSAADHEDRHQTERTGGRAAGRTRAAYDFPPSAAARSPEVAGHRARAAIRAVRFRSRARNGFRAYARHRAGSRHRVTTRARDDATSERPGSERPGPERPGPGG